MVDHIVTGLVLWFLIRRLYVGTFVHVLKRVFISRTYLELGDFCKSLFDLTDMSRMWG